VPRVDSETDSPIAGMDKLVGTERTVARVATAGGVLAAGAANLLAAGDGDGAGSAWLPPRAPTLIAATPASSRNAATNNHDFDTADLLAAGDGDGAGGAWFPPRRRRAVIDGRAISRRTAATDNHDFDSEDLSAAGDGGGTDREWRPRRWTEVIDRKDVMSRTSATSNHDCDRFDPTWKSWVMKTRWIPPGWRGDDAEA
jgi:hypothetical protein